MQIFFLWVAAFALFTSCAYEGVIVRKTTEPVASSLSLGVDMSYRFDLKDRVGNIRSQLVSAEVFQAYHPGDYFYDLQEARPARPTAFSKDGKEIQAGLSPRPEFIPVSPPRFEPIPLQPEARPLSRPELSRAPSSSQIAANSRRRTKAREHTAQRQAAKNSLASVQ